MIEQHTPGPWLLNDKAGYEYVLADDGFMIADCINFSRSEEINRANARLISAAPDLLAACIEFVRKVDAGEGRPTRSSEDMRAAINKATSA
jgi:hypothetical protein